MKGKQKVSQIPVLSTGLIFSWLLSKYWSGKISEKAGWVKKGKGFRVALFNSLLSYVTLILFAGLVTQAARELKTLDRLPRKS